MGIAFLSPPTKDKFINLLLRIKLGEAMWPTPGNPLNKEIYREMLRKDLHRPLLKLQFSSPLPNSKAIYTNKKLMERFLFLLSPIPVSSNPNLHPQHMSIAICQ